LVTQLDERKTTAPAGSRPSRNILLLIFEFVPIGDAQIIRWANLVHFMAEQGQQVTVLAGDYRQCSKPQDDSLQEITDHPNIRIERVPVDNCDSSRMALFSWSRAAYRKAIDLQRETPFDVVLSSALPIWAHMVGHALRRNGHIPYWIADYGDPWSTSRTLGQGRLKLAVERIIEREILRLVDTITVTTDAAIQSFTPLYNHPDRIAVVPMGASYFHMQADWSSPPRKLETGDPLHVLYPGSFYPTREPDQLFAGLAQVDGVHLQIVGRHHIDMAGRAERYGVTDAVTLSGYATQQQVVEIQKQADVLLLTSWPVPEQLSGKFYEYLVTNKPILYVTNHERDLASDIMREKGIGTICQHTPEAIAEALRDLRDKARAGTLQGHTPQTEYGFDVRAAAYLDVIENVIADQALSANS